MIPWIADRTHGDNSYLLDGGTGWPLLNLVVLLSDIVQESREKDQLVLVDAPRPVVFHGYGDASYLFWKKSRVPFVSFAAGSSISSVGFRYNDPMDQRSGRRKSPRILTGWQGVADLLNAAVRCSKVWKNLETIQVGSRKSYSCEHVTYEVWATPSCNRLVTWRNGRNYDSGAYRFFRNKAEKLAHVQVTKEYIDGHLLETVDVVSLYPEISGRPTTSGRDFYDNRRWLLWEASEDDAESSACLPPVHVDLSEQQVVRWQPHDEFELTINWM